MKQTLTVIGISLILHGCAATSDAEIAQPKPFNVNHSYAYNIANQTMLTANKSKLRDFTREEVEELKKVDLVGGNAGSASMFFGAISLLTGDFASAAINLSGGIVADLSAKKHMSGNSRFIITNTLSSHDQSDEIASTIRNALLEILPKGYKIERISFREATFDFIVGGKCDSVAKLNVNFEDTSYSSVNANDYSPNLKWCNSGGFEANDGYKPKTNAEEFYNYKTNLKNTITSNYGFNAGFEAYGVLNFTSILTAMGLEINSDNYNKVVKEISSKLPDGFYYYKTNFPKDTNKTNGKTHTLLDIMPAIFNKGKMYEFVEPEQKAYKK